MLDVSVIIATYNVGRYIARAVNSALAQEGVRLEVIVVDDCSTDDTWEIISNISDPRLRIRRNHENYGPSATRNEAIAMASGKWIAVLDGDDEFLPGRLQRCLTSASGADIVVDMIEVRRESDNKVFPMYAPTEFSNDNRLSLAHFIAGNRMFMKGYTLGYLKPVFSSAFLRHHKIAYDHTLRIGEDYLLLAQALACGGICIVEPSLGYAYTVRAGSISHRLALSDIDCMIKSDNAFLAHYNLHETALSAQRRRHNSLLQAYRFTQLVDALKRKDILSAWRIAIAHPGAAVHLWRPAAARLRQLQFRQ